MCTRYPIINRVSELKVHIELTRFVQPEKIEIDANERAVNEKSQYCFFVCTTFDSFLNDLSNSNPHYILKITALYITFATIQCRYFYFLRYTKPNIFLYTIISYTEFDLFSFSGLDGNAVEPHFSWKHGMHILLFSFSLNSHMQDVNLYLGSRLGSCFKRQ